MTAQDFSMLPSAAEADQLVRTAMLLSSIRTAMLLSSMHPARADEAVIAVPDTWWPGEELTGRVTVLGRPVIRLAGIDKPVVVLSAFGPPVGVS